MSERQAWDAGRFLQTVTFFDLFPFLRLFPCLKSMILGRDRASSPTPLSPRIGTILVAGSIDNLNTRILQHLLAKNYPVKVLTPNGEPLESDWRNRVEYCQGNLVHPESLPPDLMAGVQAVIYSDRILDGAREREIETLVRITVDALGTDPLSTPLFNFTHPSEAMKATWGAIDDVVMGGVSQSTIRLAEGTAIFSGTVSTVNSGGFASVRNRNFSPPIDLSAYEGVRLRGKGDGQRYKFIMRCEGKWDGVSYCYSFDTVANTWIDVSIPFEDFIPTFRAKTVSEAAKFDASQTYSMQLMLSKFEYDSQLNPKFTPGYFELQIESIKVYGNQQTPKFILVSPPDAPGEGIVKNSGLTYGMIDPENGSSERVAERVVGAIASMDVANQA